MKQGTNYGLLVSAVAALGGLMFGFDVGIISGAAPFVQQHFQLDELQLGWGASALLLGCMFGSMFAGRLADAFGRKRTLLYIALIFAVSSVLTALAPGLNHHFGYFGFLPDQLWAARDRPR